MGYFWWLKTRQTSSSGSGMTSSSVAGGGTQHSTPLSLMSCVRESSPQELAPLPSSNDIDLDRNEPSKKRRFHPFRGLRRMFRRKARNSSGEEAPESGVESTESGPAATPAKDSHRSRSTSELLAGDEPARRKSGSGIYPGLSVSHDSVFTADQNSSNSTSSDLDLDAVQSSSSLSIQQLVPGVRAELLDVVRRRRGRGDTSEDDEDLGLPRSPCPQNSPISAEKALKDHPTKSHSTCSDGSLLSMGSSEMDDDSFGPNSRNSSKLSLHDRPNRTSQAQISDNDMEFGTGTVGAPLSHSAARHKMSIKPKRTHGAPRRRRTPQVTTPSALPTTLEVNEEVSVRSLTPESSTTRESIAELYTSSSTSMNRVWNASSPISEHRLKSASLPPGLVLPSSGSKVSRSRSNAGIKAGRDTVPEEEEEQAVKEDKKKEESFFGRFLARRSGKKQAKKSKSEDITTIRKEVSSTYKQVEDLKMLSVDSEEQIKKFKSENMQTKTSESSSSYVKHVIVQKSEMHVEKTGSEDFVLKTDSTLVEKPLKKIKSEEKQLKTNESITIEKNYKKSKSEDSNVVKTVEPLSLYKQIDDRRSNSIDSSRVSSIPRSGPASRQRIQPIDIPASPDLFRRQQPLDNDSSLPTIQNSPDKPLIISESSPPKRNLFSVNLQTKVENNEEKIETEFSETVKTEFSLLPGKPWSGGFSEIRENKFEEKTKVKITGLSSYQQRVLSYDEFDSTGYKSLNDNFEDTMTKQSVTKSHSFRSKTSLSATQDFPSLPFVSKSEKLETLANVYCSKTAIPSPESEKKELSLDYDSLDRNEPISFISHSDSIEIDKTPGEEKVQKSNDGVTISCVNSQVLSSVNTQSSNQVIVSISNVSDTPIENLESEPNENLPSQVSITRVQLKKDSKTVESGPTVVPEFLKIQLNKVDVKSASNIVLSTSPDLTEDKQIKLPKNLEIEVDNENVEIMMDLVKRKFSKDDVEIIDKESQEVLANPVKSVVMSNQQFKVEDNTNKKQNTVVSITKNDRKISIVSSPPAKPFLKLKSKSIDLAESPIKSLTQNGDEKMAVSSETLNLKPEVLKDKTASAGDIQESSEPIMLRRKSSASQKRDKDSEEPELMKVFARRSLKLKDCEAETLSQQVMVLVENSTNEQQSESTNENNNTTRSRDSDKENEFNESPPEERKRLTFQTPNLKDTIKPLIESKFVESSEVMLRKPVNNKITTTFNTPRFQKSVSVNQPSPVIENTTPKNKSFIEPKSDLKPKIFEKNINRTRILAFKEKDVDIKKSTELANNKNNVEVITNVSPKSNEFENEEYVPMFKRISQRKEEWEQRAQQAKKTLP